MTAEEYEHFKLTAPTFFKHQSEIINTFSKSVPNPYSLSKPSLPIVAFLAHEMVWLITYMVL